MAKRTSAMKMGGGAVSLCNSYELVGKKEFGVLFGLILAVAVLGVGALAQPAVNESTVSADVLYASNDSFAVSGETLRVGFSFTEAANGTPEVDVDFWLGGSKTGSRSMNFQSKSSDNVSWVFDYAINSSDSNADHLEVNVGNVCNSSGSCSDPSPSRINVSVVSRGNEFSVSNASNLADVFRKTESGGTITFSAGAYRNVHLTIGRPVTLASDTGDYRTSGVIFSGNVLWRVNSDNVTIKGFRFESVTSTNVIWVGNGASNLRFEKNKFTSVRKGIDLYQGSYNSHNKNVFIVDNEFSHSTDNFIYAEYFGDSVIEDNVITGVSNTRAPIFVSGSFNLSFSNNKINASGWGIFADLSSDIDIKGNVFENIDLNPPHTYNHIIFKSPIYIARSHTGVIENNTITGSHDAIILCSSCSIYDPSYPTNQPSVHSFTVRNNRIHSNSGQYDVLNSNRNPAALDAAYNYWGGPDGPNLGRLWGSVSYSPYYADESLSSLVFAVVRDLTSEESNVFQFNESGVVQNVSLSLSSNVSGSRLAMRVLDSRPESTRRVSSSVEVYRYFEISDDVNESLVEGASITFTVPKSWLNSNRIDRNAVTLMRFGGGRWVELNTSFVNETSDEAFFSAESPGFSFFAITGIRSVSSSRSSGGGRRGGSAYIPAASTFPWLFVDQQAVNVVQSLSPDEPFVFDTSERGVVVTSVALDVNTEALNAVLVAASLKSRPSSTSAAPEGTVYRYVGVATDNVNKAFIDGVTTTFAVSKEWMSSNNAGSENIVLFAYDNASSSWVNAGARMTNETDESVLFEAGTRGSEIFAIVSQGEKTTAETPAEHEEPETTPPPPDPADAEQDEPDEIPPVPEQVPPEPERGGLSPLAAIIIILLAAGIAAFAFAKYYKKRRT